MPIKVSLSIYGIGGIITSNQFRVDYLPSVYIENVYFYIDKITHDISDTWKKTLDAQMRLKPMAKDDEKTKVHETDVDIILSRSVLDKYPFKIMNSIKVMPFIKNLKPVQRSKNMKYINYILSFESRKTATLKFPDDWTLTGRGYTEVTNLHGSKPKKIKMTEGENYKLIIQGKYWIVILKGDDEKKYDIDVNEKEEK